MFDIFINLTESNMFEENLEFDNIYFHSMIIKDELSHDNKSLDAMFEREKGWEPAQHSHFKIILKIHKIVGGQQGTDLHKCIASQFFDTVSPAGDSHAKARGLRGKTYHSSHLLTTKKEFVRCLYW